MSTLTFHVSPFTMHSPLAFIHGKEEKEKARKMVKGKRIMEATGGSD